MPDDSAVTEQPSKKVTLLILSHNCLGALRRSIQAARNPSGDDTPEILVVDKGSRDGSAQVDSEIPEATVLRLPRNFGQTKALNIGVRTAAGEFVLILTPEFELSSDAVAAMRTYLEQHADTIAVAAVPVDESGHVYSPLRPLPDPGSLWRSWRSGSTLPLLELPAGAEVVPGEAFEAAPVMVRKQFIRGMNFFDEHYGEFGWEMELSWQIQRASRRLMVLTAVRALHHEDARPVLPPGAQAQLAADRGLGMATYLGKHSGVAAGIAFRFKASFIALGRALVALFHARDVGYHFSLLTSLVSGQRIDGSQSSI
ncbi:MAG: glycosyltransferase [Bryobacterales bacterium]|nr:glycosyltransferase [Bryobacterales bacterium]